MRFGIISAGEGSRLAQDGFGVPKPLVPICGVPMIERLARIFMDCGAERIAVIVNGENPETVDLLNRLSGDLPIDLVVKRTPTPMHSMLELAPYLGTGKFCVTTVDTVFPESVLRRMIERFAQSEAHGIMGVTSFIDDEKPLYVETRPDMSISAFRDDRGVCSYVSAGVYALDGRALSVLSECVDSGQTRLRVFQRGLLEHGFQLEAFDMGRVVDVDHGHDVELAQQVALEL